MPKTLKIEGKKVKDAKKRLQITITPQDVKYGAKKDANFCAAAMALMRQEGCDEAKVHATRTYVKKAGQWFRYETPPALRSEVVAFDRGGTFEPGEYELIPPRPSQVQGMRAKRAPSQSRHEPPKTRRKQHITTGVRERFNVGGKII